MKKLIAADERPRIKRPMTRKRAARGRPVAHAPREELGKPIAGVSSRSDRSSARSSTLLE
jgi:hypothetical protein